LRRDLIRQILGVPLRQLEEIGSARILVALTDDIFNITQALLAIPVVAVNLAVLLGGAAYLAWLSWKILAVVFALIVLGGMGYRLMIARAFHWLTFARAEEDRLFGYFRALTEGIKELKLHRMRRGAFYQHIRDTTDIYQQHNVAAETCFITAQNWNHLLYFGLIGLILFVVPRLSSFSHETLTGYVITSLYLMGPLAGVMTSISLFGRASVALQKVDELGVSLATHSTETCSFDQIETEASFSRLELKGGILAGFAGLVIALQLLVQSEFHLGSGQQDYIHRLMPPVVRLSPRHDEAKFFADLEQLKTKLDQARTEGLGASSGQEAAGSDDQSNR